MALHKAAWTRSPGSAFSPSPRLVCYALEPRSHWWVLGFAFACLLGSAYGFLQGAWPFGIVEAIWAAVAVWRWRKVWREQEISAPPP